MSKIFSIHKDKAAASEPPLAPNAPFRDVLRAVEGGTAALREPGEPVSFTEHTEPAMRRIAQRYGFERLPATWGELYGLFEYCDSLDAASGERMVAPDQLADFRKAALEVWGRKNPGLVPAIERFCAGDIDGLRELHRREDTLTRLGRRT
jgi:hypothetical protein